MSTAKSSPRNGYLPNDVSPFEQVVLLGFQHVLTMFSATLLVVLPVGFYR